MRNSRTLLIAGLVVLAAITGYFVYENNRLSADLAQTRTGQTQAEDRYQKMVGAIAEIQDSLDAIPLGENAKLTPGGLEEERRMGGANREQALERISLVQASIARNKERIQELEANLKKSGVENKTLNRLVRNLKDEVAMKETQVAELTARVGELENENGTLKVQVAETTDSLNLRTHQLEEKRREEATIYYVVGDKKELENAGLIKTSGGLLGLGKTIVPTGASSIGGYYVPMDTDRETVIRTTAKEVKILSAQPPSTYEIVNVDGVAEIRILDPANFRKVKQVVILAS